MGSLRITIIASILCHLVASVNAQLISVKSQMETDSMMIGDQMVYTLQVEAAENVEFLMPTIKDTLSRNLEILYPISSDTVIADA